MKTQSINLPVKNLTTQFKTIKNANKKQVLKREQKKVFMLPKRLT